MVGFRIVEFVQSGITSETVYMHLNAPMEQL